MWCMLESVVWCVYVDALCLDYSLYSYASSGAITKFVTYTGTRARFHPLPSSSNLCVYTHARAHTHTHTHTHAHGQDFMPLPSYSNLYLKLYAAINKWTHPSRDPHTRSKILLILLKYCSFYCGSYTSSPIISKH